MTIDPVSNPFSGTQRIYTDTTAFTLPAGTPIGAYPIFDIPINGNTFKNIGDTMKIKVVMDTSPNFFSSDAQLEFLGQSFTGSGLNNRILGVEIGWLSGSRASCSMRMTTNVSLSP